MAGRRVLLRLTLCCALGLTLLSAGTARAQTSDCSTLGQTSFVHRTLQDIYYWYRELPALNPALFDSPEAYLEAARFRPLDTSFSYIAARAATEAFYSDSQFVGIGIGTLLTAEDELRVTQVFPDGPAGEAGLQRGDRILAIGGRTVADLYTSGDLGGAFGPSEIGVSVDLRLRGLDGAERAVTLVKRLVTIPTVSDVRVIEADGRLIGYVHFRNFVRPSTAALDAAFQELKTAGVSDVVLDLRYNGGGLVSVAQHLGGLIGGVRTNAQVFAEYFHNDKNAFRNEAARFTLPTNTLDLPRLTVVTTRASASASELMINALRPFMPVTVVGAPTYGKPVGQYGFNFCDKTFFPVSFLVRNAKGESDFFDGFAPDCPAPDDLDRRLGDPAEASLAEALHFVRTGACSSSSKALKRLAPRERPELRAGGWQVLLGAH